MGGGGGGILESVCLSSCPCIWFCPDDISWNAQPVKSNLVWWWVSCRKIGSLSSYLHYQGHSEGLYNQSMTNSTICSKLHVHLQPVLVWQYSIISQSILWKNLVTDSRSRSQRRFKMSVNVCSDDIFWTTEPFVTKLGMVMQQHEPECLAEKKFCYYCLPKIGLLSLRSRSQWTIK